MSPAFGRGFLQAMEKKINADLKFGDSMHVIMKIHMTECKFKLLYHYLIYAIFKEKPLFQYEYFQSGML